MTRRLATVIVGVVVATLLLVGGGTLVLANVRARHNTERELRTDAAKIAANIDDVLDLSTITDPAVIRRRLRLVRSFGTILPIDDVAVLISGAGNAFDATDLPAGITLADIGPIALAQLHLVSGIHGNLVFAAAPTRVENGRIVVVVLTRKANAALGASVRYFLVSAIVVLLLGLALAVVLGRRLTRRIRDASAATQRIAAGQLTTRVAAPRSDEHDEIAELARSINGMAEGLERAKVLEQQFLLSVSHDLRTPLTSIRGYAEAITDGAADPAAAAAVIGSESRRLERLVADLLDLAKLQARAFSLHAVPLDLTAAAITATSGFAPDAAERGITLRTAQGAAVHVLADPDRLAQVAANLIENALKYARFEVQVSVHADGTAGVFVVDDDGPGIAPDDMPHVFERLYVARARPQRRESSSGLGLAIVRELVEAMGGTVGAGISPSSGARIWFRLPLLPATPPVVPLTNRV
ncbi:MAG: HAMP domain-containing sensor histidine kinase [Ilumatobacteraceae bacterium]